MKKKVMYFLVLLVAFMTVIVVSADTLDENGVDRIANLAVETVVPDKVLVKVVMKDGSFKIGKETFQGQTSIELPYASDLTVTPVGEKLTNVSLDFSPVTPAYHLDASVFTARKIRTDGTVTLIYKIDESTGSLIRPQDSGTILPSLSETERIWLNLMGLVFVICLVIVVKCRRHFDQE